MLVLETQRHKEVPIGRVTLGMANLFVESLRGVHSQYKPLHRSVVISTEQAPSQGLYIEASHAHGNFSCWNFLVSLCLENKHNGALCLQQVTAGPIQSDFLTVTEGVTWGSVLGPFSLQSLST